MGLSLTIPLLCCFVPFSVIIPCCRSICSIGVCLSSSGSAAVSAIMRNMVEYLLDDAEIILVTCSVVGIITGLDWHLTWGLSNGIWLASQKTAYVSSRFFM